MAEVRRRVIWWEQPLSLAESAIFLWSKWPAAVHTSVLSDVTKVWRRFEVFPTKVWTLNIGCAHLPMPVWSGATVSLRLHTARRRFQPPPSIRSSSLSQLVIRRTRLSAVADRAFPVAGSRLWNCLPSDVTVTSTPTLTVFRNRLKTHLFSRSLPS